MANREEVNAGTGDNPSEAERLQVKCLRLENKVKALKDVSLIRKNLLELRERESKDLIRRLQGFEEAVKAEKEKRQKLSCRMKEADDEYRELVGKLSENVLALNQAKTLYEARIRALTVQLDEAAESLQTAAEEKEDLGKRLVDQSTCHGNQIREMEARISEVEDAREQEIKGLERGQTEVTAELLKVVKENDFLKEEIALNEANKVLVLHENTLLLESLQNLELELKVARKKNEVLSSRPCLQNTEIIHSAPQNGRKTTIMVDVIGILDKLDEAEDEECLQIPGQENCYKSVETSDGGSQLVLSVSRTYIKLKDLIVEKKELQNEIHGLKQLTKKLETKVDKESRRLYLVSLELNKTWRLVGKLKAQHGQLHSSKSVQRYELQEKRRLLETLKRDLGASRAKWVKVREKNLASQLEWESIRDEFARRRREEVCQSRESAFFEEESSSATTSIEEDGGDEDASASGDYLEEEEDHMEPRAGTSTEVKVEEGHGDTEDSFVVDLAGEIDSINAQVEDSQDEVLDESVDLTYEELINRRAHRLRQLEEQCHHLYTKLKLSKDRNMELASKLANLHSYYGSENNATTSEDSAMEGDEIGFLTETSGDTAYVSQSGDTLSNTMEVDDTEIPFDIEDQDDDMVRRPEFVQIGPVLEATGQAAEFSDSYGQVVDISLPAGEQGVHPHEEWRQVHEEVACTIRSVAVQQDFQLPPSASSSGTNPSAGTEGESFPEDQHWNQRSITSTSSLLAEEERIDGDECVVIEFEADVGMTSLPHQPRSSNYSFEPDCDAEKLYTATSIDEEGSSSNPSDVNKLSRIIIQQLPKLLDVLKQENLGLKSQATETEELMKVTRRELEEQKDLLLSLHPQLQASLSTEMELRSELDLKQRLIQELTTKIQITTENYQAINQEHARMADYVKIKLQDSEILEQRKLVKLRNIKTCMTCTKKFTLFKRKIHCSTCGHSFCAECLIHQDSQSQMSSKHDREPHPKKRLFCISCHERKRMLESFQFYS